MSVGELGELEGAGSAQTPHIVKHKPTMRSRLKVDTVERHDDRRQAASRIALGGSGSWSELVDGRSRVPELDL